jgi:hypothetical protein
VVRVLTESPVQVAAAAPRDVRVTPTPGNAFPGVVEQLDGELIRLAAARCQAGTTMSADV